jgi:alkaline phosphatase
MRQTEVQRVAVGLVVASLTVAAVVGARVERGSVKSSPTPAPEQMAAPARNVILFVGDGMGDSEITLARYYARGARGRLALDVLPSKGSLTTFAVHETAPHLPNYVPDSAATATAWSTGRKTSNGRISTSAGDDDDLKTILEYAQARGYRTGGVTTAELSDATPATLAAHVAHRECQGPADMVLCPDDRRQRGGPGANSPRTGDDPCNASSSLKLWTTR